jgi:hypothetical protein
MTNAEHQRAYRQRHVEEYRARDWERKRPKRAKLKAILAEKAKPAKVEPSIGSQSPVAPRGDGKKG